MQTKGTELAVGLFIVAGLLALTMLALKVGHFHVLGRGQTYQVTADFGNIGSLKPRAPVTAAGVRVGEVRHIALNPRSYRAVVTLRLLKRYRFPRDSSAAIDTAGLLGEQYVSLSPGGSRRYLKNGGKIRVTQSAIILEQVISQLLYKKAGHG